MKQTILRILCAFLLMGIALTVTLGVFAAAKQEEEIYTWQRVYFETAQEVQLFSADGELVQTLEADGIVASELLPEGRYYAFSGNGCVEFVLCSDCSVRVEGGCGWTDGKLLHLTDEPVGSVSVEFLSQVQGFCEFTLVNGEYSRREVIRCGQGQVMRCDFLGVPYGTYTLYRQGEALVSVIVSSQTPAVSVALSS